MHEATTKKMGIRDELRQQRWDDHRYYHHSRINQSLHLLSATCFLTTYAMILFDPGTAVLLGWIVAMCSRQIGHFFFEPKTYDTVNHASHDHKEAIKIGYNLRRKRILLAIWAMTPVALYLYPSMFGLFERHQNWSEYIHNLSIVWLIVAVGALIFRTVHLFFIYNVRTGVVWAMKILTDPFHDFKIYFKSPLYLMKGELIDPMTRIADDLETDYQEPKPATH